MASRKRTCCLVSAVLFLLALLAGAVMFALVGYLAFNTLLVPDLNVSKSDSEPERIEKIDAWLTKLQENDFFNGAVLVSRAGQSILMKTYGFTDCSDNDRLTTRSSFRLASLSKQFTAAAILVLVEQNKIDLDEPVATYLDGFPFADVTVRHLLNMVSGFRDDYMSLAGSHRDDFGEILTVSEVVKLVNKYPPKRTQLPNGAYEYSNTNYVLLAAIVENVSGQSFEAFLQEQLFGPLGMQDSRVWNLLSEEKTFPGKLGTSMFGVQLEPDWLDGVAGDGAVFSSIEDFRIWETFWNENQLVSADLIEQALQPPTLNDGTESSYGFGWVVLGERAFHDGSWLGARTFTIRDTKNKIYIVVLDNASSNVVDQIGNKIREAILK